MSLFRICSAALLILLLPLCIRAARAAEDAEGMQRLQDASRDLARVGDENLSLYLDGKPEKALAALDDAAEAHGWAGMVAVANMIWTMHPQASLERHERAYRDSGENPSVLLELGLHYTRYDQCERALESWKTLDSKGLYGRGYFPALAAYCHLRLEQDEAAFAELRKAEFGRHGGMAYARVLGELWGERPVLARYADAFAAYRQGQTDASLESVIKEAGVLPTGSGLRYEALLRVTAAAATREPADSPALRELSCLRPLLEEELAVGKRARERGEISMTPAQKAEHAGEYAETDRLLGPDDEESADRDAMAKRWNRALERCALMVGEHPLPVSSHLLRMLVVEQQARGIVDPREQLTRYGKALWARADSARGDETALEILAALQSAAGDKDALRRSDELGWRRYRLRKFAASRIVGELLSTGQASASALAMLDEALQDFPDDPVLLQLAIEEQPLEGEKRATMLRRLLIAYHKMPPPQSVLHVGPSSSHVIGAWMAYAKAKGMPLR